VYTSVVLLEALPILQPIIIQRADTDPLSGGVSCMYIYTSMYTYISTHIYMHTYKYMYVYVYTCAVLLGALPIPQPIIISRAEADPSSGGVTCMCIYTCMYTYIHTYF